MFITMFKPALITVFLNIGLVSAVSSHDLLLYSTRPEQSNPIATTEITNPFSKYCSPRNISDILADSETSPVTAGKAIRR